MADNDLIAQITDIIIEQIVNQRIPTVVFLSDIKTDNLVKNIIWTIKGGNKDTNTYTPDDWNEVVKIMTDLSEIPLLLQETTNINEIKANTEYFIKEVNSGKGLVIVNSEVSDMPFTKNKNISIIIV